MSVAAKQEFFSVYLSRAQLALFARVRPPAHCTHQPASAAAVGATHAGGPVRASLPVATLAFETTAIIATGAPWPRHLPVNRRDLCQQSTRRTRVQQPALRNSTWRRATGCSKPAPRRYRHTISPRARRPQGQRTLGLGAGTCTRLKLAT